MGKLILQRYSGDTQSTLGVLLDADIKKFVCHILEDQAQEKKVAKETRIWEKSYTLKIRKELTPLTVKYRERYPWFKYFIEVTGVDGFTGIYIHAGKDDDWTEGCLLTGDTVNNNVISKGKLGDYNQAMKRVYDEYYPRLEKGEAITIKVRDESYLYKD